MHYNHIIIGASAAGMSAFYKLQQLAPDATIAIISAESELPYNKCLLVDYGAGIKEQNELSLPFEQDPRYTVILGMRVKKINPADSTILLSDGRLLHFDHLLIATGSRPAVSPLFQARKFSNCFFFHTLSDLQKLRDYVARNAVKKITIIGAGLSGLECADMLLKWNVAISIIERNEQILSSVISSEQAHTIMRRMDELNIAYELGAEITGFGDVEGKINTLSLNSGKEIQTDLVILATGTTPNSEVARDAGIVCNKGIVVNEQFQTSYPTIFAAGDVIGQSSTWADAVIHGQHAACAMAGSALAYQRKTIPIRSTFFNLKLAIDSYQSVSFLTGTELE